MWVGGGGGGGLSLVRPRRRRYLPLREDGRPELSWSRCEIIDGLLRVGYQRGLRFSRRGDGEGTRREDGRAVEYRTVD